MNAGFVLLAAVGAAALPATPCCGTSCPSCPWRAPDEVRVRREVRDLSATEWQRVTNAMNTMKRVATKDGEAAFGAAYRSYDYFTAKHYAACIDARGNGAHYGPQFAMWHAPRCPNMPRADGSPSDRHTAHAHASTMLGSTPARHVVPR